MSYVRPRIVTHRDALAEVLSSSRAALVCAAPEPWAWLEQQGIESPRAVRMAESTDQGILEACEASLPGGDVVIGIGGGTAVDNAKYVAWKRNLPLVTLPSALSVDAFLTNQVAVRREGVVTYIGNIWPETVLIHHDLIRTAPARLNRAGAADILSIHTALFDWAVAAEDCGEPYNEDHAQEAREILLRLEFGAEDISSLTDRGIDLLVELFKTEVELCARNGNSRPEEGSEHLFAYNFEKLTGRHLIHGELVGTGIWFMSRLQGNDSERVTGLMDRLKIRYRPDPEDMRREELEEALLTLGEFVEAEGSFYSVVNRLSLASEAVKGLVDGLLD